MSLSRRHFNQIFLPIWVACLAALLFSGCKTTEQKKKDKQATEVSIYLEATTAAGERIQTVQVGRRYPAKIVIVPEAVIDTRDVASASVVQVDEVDGFGIQLQMNKHGIMSLDSITSESKGLRLVILARYDMEIRWLAAPRIQKRIADGKLVFTADCDREEADRIVRGLANMIKQMDKPYVF